MVVKVGKRIEKQIQTTQEEWYYKESRNHPQPVLLPRHDHGYCFGGYLSTHFPTFCFFPCPFAAILLPVSRNP